MSLYLPIHPQIVGELQNSITFDVFLGYKSRVLIPHKNKSPAPHSSLRQRVFLLRACVVVGYALRLQPHAAGDAQRSSNSGQDGDQRLDDEFPNVFLVHFVN